MQCPVIHTWDRVCEFPTSNCPIGSHQKQIKTYKTKNQANQCVSATDRKQSNKQTNKQMKVLSRDTHTNTLNVSESLVTCTYVPRYRKSPHHPKTSPLRLRFEQIWIVLRCHALPCLFCAEDAAKVECISNRANEKKRERWNTCIASIQSKTLKQMLLDTYS